MAILRSKEAQKLRIAILIWADLNVSMKFRACNFLVIPIFAFSACSGQSESEPKAQSCVIETGTFANVIGGTAKLGSEQHYREERPLRKAEITSFNIDETEVTNGQFAAFVDATGYITDAEKPQPGYDVTGGAVFVEPTDENPSWWQFIDGANWRHPEGPDSSIKGRAFEPVVQVSLNDARAYAKWAGRRLPTESEWEYAANAGADTEFVWGDERAPNDKEMANSWQGTFPIENTLEDGYLFRAPVGCYDPNNFGLYDMIGNVWEWTETVYQDSAGEPIHVIKGGSFLCAPNYCRRYRSSARQPQEAGLPTNHIGFRTVGKISD